MNVLDENVPRDQADLLRQWGVRYRLLSRDLGYQGIDDEDIRPLLLRLKKPTLLTRDEDFFRQESQTFPEIFRIFERNRSV